MTGVGVPTTLTGTIRYLPPGIRQYNFVLDLADPASPTAAELAAGTDITPEVVDGSVTGFSTTASTVEAPAVGSKITPKVQGRTSLDDSSMNLYLSEDSTDARTLFTEGTGGFMVIYPEGNHASNKMDVFPVTVQNVSIDQDTTKVAQFKVDFALSDLPHKNLAIPTSA